MRGWSECLCLFLPTAVLVTARRLMSCSGVLMAVGNLSSLVCEVNLSEAMGAHHSHWGSFVHPSILAELSGWENSCLASGLSCPIPPLSQGLNFLIPLLDRIRYVQSLKEIVINVPEQSAVTLGKKGFCLLSLLLHLE